MKNKTYNKKKSACGLSRSGHSDLRIDRTAVLSDDFDAEYCRKAEALHERERKLKPQEEKL
ncbi:MAG: hypothetical protein ACLSXO_03870 [Coprococcus sp.]